MKKKWGKVEKEEKDEDEEEKRILKQKKRKEKERWDDFHLRKMDWGVEAGVKEMKKKHQVS